MTRHGMEYRHGLSILNKVLVTAGIVLLLAITVDLVIEGMTGKCCVWWNGRGNTTWFEEV